MSDYKPGDRVQIEFEIEVPANCSAEELDAWIDFELNAKSSINSKLLERMGELKAVRCSLVVRAL